MIRSSFRLTVAAALLCFTATAGVCQAGQWSTVAPMQAPREALGAASGPDGRLYVIGGDQFFGITNVVEAYNPLTNTWTFVAPMTTPRAEFACVTGPDGRIYAFGGRGLNSAEAYDTAANKWSPIASLPIDASTEQVRAAALGNDGKIYAFIGCIYNTGLFFPSYLRTYDVATDTWSGIINPPVTLSTFYSQFASDAAGIIYAAGALQVDSSALAFRFDPRANTWTPIQTMPYQFGHFTPGGDGRIYALGGPSWSGLAYDPVLDSWTAVPSSNLTQDGSSIAMGPDGHIYALGGEGYDYEGSLVTLTTVQAYLPARNTYAPNVTATTIHAIERVMFTGVVANFTDPHLTNAADFTATIQWGDGQTSSGLVSANGSGGFNVTATHTYTSGGSFATRVGVSAKDGRVGVSIGSAAVTPQLSATGLNITSGKSYSGPVVNFTDLNPSAPSAYKATIQWGDGSSSAGTIQTKAGGGFTVSGKHTYNQKRSTYSITVTVTKSGDSPATAFTIFHWNGK